jgi:hypothetical protein
MSNLQPSAQVLEIFNNEFKDKLAFFEQKRLDTLKKSERMDKTAKKYGWKLIILISIIASAYLENIAGFFIFGLAYYIYLSYPGIVFNYKVNKVFNKKVFPYILKNIFNIDYYDKDRKIDKKVFQDCELIEKFATYNSHDYMCGKSNNISYEIAHVDLSINRNDRNVTCFNGLAIKLTMPFNFLSHTAISNTVINRTHLRPVRLENPEFENSYSTYSTDQQAARYLITPGFMQKAIEFSNNVKAIFSDSGTYIKPKDNVSQEESATLKHLAEKAKYKHIIEYEFKNNQLLILIPMFGNIFHPFSVYKSVYDLTNLAKIEMQLKCLTSIIEQLNFDYLAARKSAYNKLNS